MFDEWVDERETLLKNKYTHKTHERRTNNVIKRVLINFDK